MTSYSRGDIVLVAFPFSDLTATKKRPALVVSPNSFNAPGDDLILAAVTSQLRAEPHIVRILPSDCHSGVLPKESLIRLTKVFTLNAALVQKKLCILDSPRVQAVLAALRQMYS